MIGSENFYTNARRFWAYACMTQSSRAAELGWPIARVEAVYAGAIGHHGLAPNIKMAVEPT